MSDATSHRAAIETLAVLIFEADVALAADAPYNDSDPAWDDVAEHIKDRYRSEARREMTERAR